MKTLINTFILLIFLIQNVSANEYRAGHISITQIASQLVQADIELLIDVHADIENLQICWGDGVCSTMSPQSTESLPSWGVKKYTYSILHSYQELGTYTASIENCCFDDELANMLGAEDDPFVIETRFLLSASLNTTPSYSYISVGIGPINQPAGMPGWDDDPEGDEYVTEICDIDVSTYVQPDLSLPGSEIYNNPNSGDVTWVSPLIEGTFVLQTCVSEFRNGEEISFSKRVVCLLVGNFTATTEPITESGFSIYPNPIQDKKLWIHNDGSMPSEALNIRIHNINQQLVLEEKTTTSFDNKMIDLSGLSAGVYFILMETDAVSYYEKFVVVE